MIQAFNFEVKALDDSGSFEGLASTYNNKDLLGDTVMPGAFTRTLQGAPTRPLLWLHRDPVGVVSLSDSSAGLVAKGKLSLGVQQAKEAYQLLKDGAVRGLSVGFKTVRDDIVDGVRRLHEVKLFEVSLVAIPANPEAMITAVKSLQNDDAIQRALAAFQSDIRRAIGDGNRGNSRTY